MDARRSRSFGGCGTCRNRRMKCDEGRPACSTCLVSGLTCSGYEKNIFFDFEETPTVGMSRFRRPLLTEEERESMSAELVSSVPPALTLWHIAQIEDECEGLPSNRDIQISRGPFGVFRVTSPTAEVAESGPEHSPGQDYADVADDHQVDQVDDVEEADEEFYAPPEPPPLRRTPSPVGTILSRADQRPLSPMTEWWNTGDWWNMTNLPGVGNWWDTPVDLDRVQTIAEDVHLPGLDQTPRSLLPSSEAYFPDMLAEPQPQQLATPESSTIPPAIDCAVPHDAVFLLKHYSTNVLRGFTPFRHSKTPWHVLFIPYVKSCLAALTLGEDLDHASLTAFYATLAISAASLCGASGSGRWAEQAARYEHLAHRHARPMLQTAYDVPKTAKYKSTLMAILTMVQASSASGGREQAECYLLEAEKFIRVRGLARRDKSRKVRLLHHCYAFERMLHESTLPPGSVVRSAHRRRVRRAVEASSAGAHSRDSLSFRLVDWGGGGGGGDLDRELRRPKDRQEGENDLHLQIPGVWPATLYPEIFGIPEIHVFLISLVIRLGRAMDDAKEGVSPSLADFMSRAKAVERCIHRLGRGTGAHVVTEDADPEARHCQMLLDNLARAMQLALTIYFYRRVYDVEADMMQDKVAGVRDCLLRFEATESEAGYGSARLVWPAVIAASEAEDPEVRMAFSKWFGDWARRSGLRIFSDSLADVERRWEEKREMEAAKSSML
ncbi:hypothetical protein CMUS01_15666 [Colletotrichum musicola]|uniref:Zn(2)-C6 fungal-type domain-containing protein n=1 Tax=Colletotrichum musicola TaxID=2175873 RepID=A0A8H6IUK7_9PEZI|nr:hypothetical protein CMUS01_15666 [Colletotrichum musicola]